MITKEEKEKILAVVEKLSCAAEDMGYFTPNGKYWNEAVKRKDQARKQLNDILEGLTK